MTKVTISVLTFNRSSLLRELIPELLGLAYRPLEIIVVDNHSEDDTESLMQTEFPGVMYMRTDQNIGVGARNLGMEKASGDIVITIDDDIRGLTDSHLASIVKLFRTRPRLGAVNFRVLDHKTLKGCNWVHHRPSELFSLREFQTYEISEGAVAFRSAALLDSSISTKT